MSYGSIGWIWTGTRRCTPAAAWAYYVNVDGADAAIERIKANRGQVLMGPEEVPGGSWIVQALDPQGANFALVSRTR